MGEHRLELTDGPALVFGGNILAWDSYHDASGATSDVHYDAWIYRTESESFVFAMRSRSISHSQQCESASSAAVVARSLCELFGMATKLCEYEKAQEYLRKLFDAARSRS